MTHPTCAVGGCNALRIGRTYSPYCQTHRQVLRRHGHPLQRPVTFYELAPYMAAVRATIKRNPSSEVWPILRARWGRLVEHAAGLMAERDRGTAYHLPTLQAAEMLHQVAAHADEPKVSEVVLGVFLLAQSDPRRFRCDDAVRFTLVRRLRHLAPMSRGRYWNHKLQRMGSVYRDPPPKAVMVLGAWLVEVFGQAGVMLAEHEQRRRAAHIDERARLVGAIEALA